MPQAATNWAGKCHILVCYTPPVEWLTPPQTQAITRSFPLEQTCDKTFKDTFDQVSVIDGQQSQPNFVSHCLYIDKYIQYIKLGLEYIKWYTVEHLNQQRHDPVGGLHISSLFMALQMFGLLISCKSWSPLFSCAGRCHGR